MDINNLLKNFLGGDTNNSRGNAQTDALDISSISDKAKNLAQKATQGGVGSFAGGAVAGGLLSLILSNGRARDIAGGALGYGGAALLGALAHRAYQNYKAGESAQEAAKNSENLTINNDIKSSVGPSDRDIGNFGIVLIKGMIAAAKSDGHIDNKEQEKILAEIEKMNLPHDQKSLIFDALMKPIDLQELTKNINTIEQATEFYLASCIAIEPDHPEEEKFLKSLSTILKLPPDLTNQVHQQIKTIQR